MVVTVMSHIHSLLIHEFSHRYSQISLSCPKFFHFLWIFLGQPFSTSFPHHFPWIFPGFRSRFVAFGSKAWAICATAPAASRAWKPSRTPTRPLPRRPSSRPAATLPRRRRRSRRRQARGVLMGLKSMDDLHGAIENGDLQWIYPLKMVIFPSVM